MIELTAAASARSASMMAARPPAAWMARSSAFASCPRAVAMDGHGPALCCEPLHNGLADPPGTTGHKGCPHHHLCPQECSPHRWMSDTRRASRAREPFRSGLIQCRTMRFGETDARDACEDSDRARDSGAPEPRGGRAGGSHPDPLGRGGSGPGRARRYAGPCDAGLRGMVRGLRAGPGRDPAATFKEVGGYHDIVVLRDIPFESCCEHHMAAIRGTVSVGYLPRNRVVGISKLARVVDAFAHRLQVQERLTAQIADTIDEVLAPRGVGVIVKGTHACMATRGVRKHGVSMVTSRMLGAFRDDPAARQEFLAALA